MKIHSIFSAMVVGVICILNSSCDRHTVEEKVHVQVDLVESDEIYDPYERSREILSQIGDEKIDLLSQAVIILEKDTLDAVEYKKLFRSKTKTLKALHAELGEIKGLTRNDLDKIQIELSEASDKFENLYQNYLSLIDKRNSSDKSLIGEIEFNYKQLSINEFNKTINKVFP